MKILTYQSGDGAQRLGALAPDSEHVIDLTAVAPDAITLLEGGERAIHAARQHVAHAEPEARRALNDLKLCVPVPRPSSIRETMTFEAHIINAIRLRLVTPDDITDPYNLTATARVNGEEWSRGNTGDTSYTFEELIAYMSRAETLYPGDFIDSGTISGPQGKGCGLELGRFLQPGSIVELEAEQIGVLRNRAIA